MDQVNMEKQPEPDFAVPNEDGRFLCWLHVKVTDDGVMAITGVFDFQTRELLLTDSGGATSVYDLEEGTDSCIVFDLIGDRTRAGWELMEIDFYSQMEE